MSTAKVTASQFSSLYQRFQKSYGNAESEVIVLYYRENEKVYVYMTFSKVCYCSYVPVEEAPKYLQLFNQPIQLTEKYE